MSTETLRLFALCVLLLASGCESAAATGSDGGPGTDAGTSPTDAGRPPTDAGPRPTGCEAHPEACGYPGPGNTGVPAGTTLTAHDGDLELRTPGEVVDALEVRGCIIVHAPGVTVRRTLVHCGSLTAITTVDEAAADGAVRLTIEDVEVDCDPAGNVTAVGSRNIDARRVHAHGCENGYDLDADITVEDSYVPAVVEMNGGHGDAIQIAPPADGILIRHDTLFGYGGTSAVNWTRETIGVRIEDNLLAGGAFTVYCPRVTVPVGAYAVVGNRFGTFDFGYSDDCAGGDVTWTDNYADADLSPLAPE